MWFFRNRETGAITVAQAPNLLLWIVIVAAALRWILHPAGAFGVALIIVVAFGLLAWRLTRFSAV